MESLREQNWQLVEQLNEEQTVSEKDHTKQEAVQVDLEKLRYTQELFQDANRGFNFINKAVGNGNDSDCFSAYTDYMVKAMLEEMVANLTNLCNEFYCNLGVSKKVDHG